MPLVREKPPVYKATQWDGEVIEIGENKTEIGIGPGNDMRVVDKDSRLSHIIERDSWVLFDEDGKVVKVISNADYLAKYEEII